MSEHSERTKLSAVENARKAGPVATEPAREQVVIRDKRKIDATGRPKAAEPGTSTGEDEPGTSQGGQVTGKDTRTAPADRTAREPASGAPQTVPAGANAPLGQPGTPAPAQSDPAHAGGQTTVSGTGTGPDRTSGATSKTPAGGAQPSGGTTRAGAAATDAGRGKNPPAGAGPGDPATGTAVADRAASKPTGDGVSAVEQPVPAALGAELAALRSELDERLRDLQRVTAEYANYRKRVERDRAAMAEQALATVLLALLPILDDLDRAREHGDLVGPFGAVAEQLTTALAKFGLAGFGEIGDPFDPTRHEAVAHQRSAEVAEPTCVEVMRRGYMLGDRLIRAALVSVADPE